MQYYHNYFFNHQNYAELNASEIKKICLIFTLAIQK